MEFPRGSYMNDHLTRYHLGDGLFVDRDTLTGFRWYDYKYSVWKAGAGQMTSAGYRIAGWLGGADTLKAALEIAEAAGRH